MKRIFVYGLLGVVGLAAGSVLVGMGQWWGLVGTVVGCLSLLASHADAYDAGFDEGEKF